MQKSFKVTRWRVSYFTPIYYNDGKIVYLKIDYSNVFPHIDLICYIACHIVAILACNKVDVRCIKYTEQ